MVSYAPFIITKIHKWSKRARNKSLVVFVSQAILAKSNTNIESFPKSNILTTKDIKSTKNILRIFFNSAGINP